MKVFTRPVEGYELMRDFVFGVQRDQVHVLHLLAVVGNYPEAFPAVEVGVEDSVGDLVLLRVGGEADQANLLSIKKSRTSAGLSSRCESFFVFASQMCFTPES